MASQFASIAELVTLTGDQVHARQDLRNLALVNWRFHEIFSPLLWSTLEWNTGNVELWLDANRRRHYVQSKHMAHVRAIAYTYIDHERPDVDIYPYSHTGKRVGAASHALADTVQHCVQLQSFEAHKLLVGHDLMKALAAQDSLTKLYLGFEGDMEYFLSAKSSNMPPTYLPAMLERYYGHPERYLGHFKNLQALTLLNIWGNMEPWLEGLVDALVSSPQLAHLELGLDNRVKRRFTAVHLMGLVCEGYNERRAFDYHTPRFEGHIPLLRLRSLVLRNGILFPDQYTLSQATKLKEMRYVYLYNDPTTVISELHDHRWVDWDVLSHEAMPNLQYISFHTLDLDAWTSLPDLVRSRFEAAEESGEDASTAPGLLGIYVEKDGISGLRSESPEALSILGLCARTAPLPMFSLPFTLASGIKYTEWHLKHIQDSTWVTHLSFNICDIDLAVEGRDSSLMVWAREVLASLVNLQALRIPFIGYSLPDDDCFDDVALALAEACPALRWIGLQDKSWRVSRGHVPDGDSSPPSVTVTRLEAWQADDETPEFFQGEPSPSFLKVARLEARLEAWAAWHHEYRIA